MSKADPRSLQQTAATDTEQKNFHGGVIMVDIRSIFRKSLTTGLLCYALVTCYGCASSGVGTRREPEAQPPQVENWQPCTARIRKANCDFTGSYSHVREQHCEGDCIASHESQYRNGFIDTCNDSRLAEVCFTTVQNPNCKYYSYDDDKGRKRYVVSSDLVNVVVGSDRNRQCRDSTVTTVVLDGALKVVTMHPGPEAH